MRWFAGLLLVVSLAFGVGCGGTEEATSAPEGVEAPEGGVEIDMGDDGEGTTEAETESSEG